MFGGLKRDSGRWFMIPVEQQDRATLLPIIKDWILPGTTIMSDFWKSYDCLAYEGFTHLRVNHSIEFVDSVTGACTNRIKSSGMRQKETSAHQDEENIFIMGPKPGVPRQMRLFLGPDASSPKSPHFSELTPI